MNGLEPAQECLKDILLPKMKQPVVPAYEAAVRAIESSSVKYKDIDQIIVATISGDHPLPFSLPAFCKRNWG